MKEPIITFRHMETSPALKTYAVDKLGRLEKYMIKPEEVYITMGVEKIRQWVEITIIENGNRITGKEISEDMYSSIDLVVDKLERQLKKYKEKIKHHKDNPSIQGLTTSVAKE